MYLDESGHLAVLNWNACFAASRSQHVTLHIIHVNIQLRHKSAISLLKDIKSSAQGASNTSPNAFGDGMDDIMFAPTFLHSACKICQGIVEYVKSNSGSVWQRSECVEQLPEHKRSTESHAG